jgi:hypothetical protein
LRILRRRRSDMLFEKVDLQQTCAFPSRPAEPAQAGMARTSTPEKGRLGSTHFRFFQFLQKCVRLSRVYLHHALDTS